jgi:hypothetical protein
MLTKMVAAFSLAAALAPAAQVDAAQAPSATVRRIKVNGHALSSEEMEQIVWLERRFGVRIQNAEYWYDARSGAVGFWNGPAVAAMPPGMNFGPMPSNCSGGGTGVFSNGRELHPIDVQVLSSLGPVYRGRYWVDANGNFGLQLPTGETPPIGNLFALARQTQSRGPRRVYAPGELSGIIVNSAGACTDQGNCYYPGR